MYALIPGCAEMKSIKKTYHGNDDVIAFTIFCRYFVSLTSLNEIKASNTRLIIYRVKV